MRERSGWVGTGREVGIPNRMATPKTVLFGGASFGFIIPEEMCACIPGGSSDPFG